MSNAGAAPDSVMCLPEVPLVITAAQCQAPSLMGSHFKGAEVLGTCSLPNLSSLSLSTSLSELIVFAKLRRVIATIHKYSVASPFVWMCCPRSVQVGDVASKNFVAVL